MGKRIVTVTNCCSIPLGCMVTLAAAKHTMGFCSSIPKFETKIDAGSLLIKIGPID